MTKSIKDLTKALSKPCPPPLKGKKAEVVTIGTTPYILARPVEDPKNPKKRIKVVEKDPETGNLLGVDNDITDLLCRSLQCQSYTLRVTEGNKFDYFSAREKKWKGRTGELLEGKADFSMGFSTAPHKAHLKLSITGYTYFNEAGFTTGHPRFVTSLFNVVRPFA